MDNSIGGKVETLHSDSIMSSKQVSGRGTFHSQGEVDLLSRARIRGAAGASLMVKFFGKVTANGGKGLKWLVLHHGKGLRY